MIRYLVVFISLACVIAWLVLSYAPFALPSISFSETGSSQSFLSLGALVLAGAAIIQAVLIRATVQLFRTPPGSTANESIRQFHLGFVSEVVLTALPLAMTGALALAVMAAWR